MSGGHYNREYAVIFRLAYEIEDEFRNFGIVGREFGYPSNDYIEVDLFDGVSSELRGKCLARINKLVEDMRVIAQKAKELEYILSGDSSWDDDFCDN